MDTTVPGVRRIRTQLTPDLDPQTIWQFGYAAGTNPSRPNVLVGRPARVAHWLAGYSTALRQTAENQS